MAGVASSDGPRQAAGEAVLLVALALGRHRRLLLLGEEVVVEELVGEPELRAAKGTLPRHSAQATPPLHAPE
jgi:hypothetical protein